MPYALIRQCKNNLVKLFSYVEFQTFVFSFSSIPLWAFQIWWFCTTMCESIVVDSCLFVWPHFQWCGDSCGFYWPFPANLSARLSSVNIICYSLSSQCVKLLIHWWCIDHVLMWTDGDWGLSLELADFIWKLFSSRSDGSHSLTHLLT